MAAMFYGYLSDYLSGTQLNLFARVTALSSILLLSACSAESHDDNNKVANNHAENSNNTELSSAEIKSPPVSASELKPGGDTTTSIQPFPAFDKVAENLPDDLKADFFAGKALAEQPWVKAPTITTARDGLGPLYNARACLACHIRGGKGRLPDDSNSAVFNAFLRLSIPAESPDDIDPRIGVIPEPVYGEQLQGQSIALHHQLRASDPQQIHAKGDVSPEAYVYVNWHSKTITYADGSQTEIRWPEADIRYLSYGPLHENTQISLRNAPAIHGMGLIEAIPQQAIDRLADPDDSNQDGISGRVNRVWDAVSGKTVPGRFGLKANRPNMDMVVASAFANDIGISNPLFPSQPCTAAQAVCNQQIHGTSNNEFELPAELLALVTEFSRNLAVPERRDANDPEVLNGRDLFYQSGCHLCHQPSFITRDSTAGTSQNNTHLLNQTIWPYSDFLLHDMGDGLADKRPDFLATGNEWRTPPLWGTGLSQRVNGSNSFLHDGRARSVEEAILWHGGEASGALQNFLQMDKSSRMALIRFVESL
ncbi:MAG: hypothetical protein CMI08_09045 [Oceanospirillaceae bacterium]|nr:hypothetical protein [Oceanospirillaceae bacterium]